VICCGGEQLLFMNIQESPSPPVSAVVKVVIINGWAGDGRLMAELLRRKPAYSFEMVAGMPVSCCRSLASGLLIRAAQALRKLA